MKKLTFILFAAAMAPGCSLLSQCEIAAGTDLAGNSPELCIKCTGLTAGQIAGRLNTEGLLNIGNKPKKAAGSTLFIKLKPAVK